MGQGWIVGHHPLIPSTHDHLGILVWYEGEHPVTAPSSRVVAITSTALRPNRILRIVTGCVEPDCFREVECR